MPDSARPKYREQIYDQPPEEKPLTPEQAREELGWKLLPQNAQHSHDD